MEIYYNVDVVYSWASILANVLFWLMMIIILVEALLTGDFLILKQIIWALQFMHLISLLPVFQPPSLKNFDQNLYLFSFMSPLIAQFTDSV